MSEADSSRFGEVAIVGRPNVGKSTLLNLLVGEKISITSAKPHTTRQRILGVMSRGASQAVFVDTPGHVRQAGRALHRLMSRTIHQAIETSDLILLLVEATGLVSADRQMLELLRSRMGDTIVVVNKLDKLRRRSDVLPMLAELSEYGAREYVPISARTGLNVVALANGILANLPSGQAMYPNDMVTDRSLKFRAAELIREQLLHALHEEVPYGLTVEVEHLARGASGDWLLHALIWLERESHKPIVIGKQGQNLKRVGTRARAQLIDLLGDRVHLEMWVKIREHWSDNELELQRLGF